MSNSQSKFRPDDGPVIFDDWVIRELEKGRIILASQSPRRKEILEKKFRLKPSIQPSKFPENLDKFKLTPMEYAVETSTRKAVDVYRSELDSDEPPSIVIAADTVVIVGETILEKPRSVGHHIEMLKTLRDSPFPHKVITGLTVIVPFERPVYPGYSMNTTLEDTSVVFDRKISDEEIVKYVESGEGRDAAGGYKIQGYAGEHFVKSIDGDYYNVMGLPIKCLEALIKKTILNVKMVNEDSDVEDLEVDMEDLM